MKHASYSDSPTKRFTIEEATVFHMPWPLFRSVSCLLEAIGRYALNKCRSVRYSHTTGFVDEMRTASASDDTTRHEGEAL